MRDYSKITEVVMPYRNSPEGLKDDCIDKIFADDTIVHSIKIGEKYINTREYKSDEKFEYTFLDLCSLLNPINIYDFTFCLSLYNSQNMNATAIEKIKNGNKNVAPKEYSFLLEETQGWIF